MPLLYDLRDHRLAERFSSVEDQGGRSADHVPTAPVPGWVQAALVVVVAAHMALVFANILAFFLLPFLAPWYVAVPLATFLFSFMSTRQECRLTNLENTLRQRLGKPKINGFVGHYLVRPLRRRFQAGLEPSREAC